MDAAVVALYDYLLVASKYSPSSLAFCHEQQLNCYCSSHYTIATSKDVVVKTNSKLLVENHYPHVAQTNLTPLRMNYFVSLVARVIMHLCFRLHFERRHC